MKSKLNFWTKNEDFEQCDMVEAIEWSEIVILNFFPGLLDSFGTSEDIESCWTEDHLDCPSSNESFERKVSPPYITVLSDSKCRSGSDPTISRQPAIDQKKGSRSQENSITSPKSSKAPINISVFT